MFMKRSFLFVFCCLFLCLASCGGGTYGTGVHNPPVSLKAVQIVDSSGIPIANARIAVKDSQFSTVSDDSGKCFLELPYGISEIEANVGDMLYSGRVSYEEIDVTSDEKANDIVITIDNVSQVSQSFCETDDDCLYGTCSHETQICSGLWKIEPVPSSLGVCVSKNIFCKEEWSPVCGCDGRTYSNECFANSAGVSIAHFGECVDTDGIE